MLKATEYFRKRELLVFFLMLTVSLTVYWQSFANDFLINWDDPNYITINQDAHGFSLEHLKNAFSKFYVGNYAPLHIVSYMFDYTFWGLKPFGYILHNIVLHTVNSYLLYRLVNRISAVFYPSVLAALLFLVHPVQVESVVWISQRKNLLAMFFFLLAMLFYHQYRNSSPVKCRKAYIAALIFFTCALLTKSVAVILPVVLLLVDLCIDNRPMQKSLADKVPFIAIAFIAAVIAMLSQSAEYLGGGRASFHGGSPWTTFLTMLPVFVKYLQMIIIPTDLSGVYSPDIKTAIDGSVATAALILLFLSAGALVLFRTNRKLVFWLAFGAVGILPVSQIVPLVTMMNDRYLYFPMAGVAPFIILGIARIMPENQVRLHIATTAVAVSVLLLFGVMSGIRGTYWKNSLTLWSDATRKDPDNVKAQFSLANAYMERNELDKVKSILDNILTVQPKNARFHEMLGNYYYQRGDMKNAETSYKRALDLWPQLYLANLCLGNIYLGRHDFQNAEAVFMKAAEFALMTPDLSYSIACLYSLKGDLPKAVDYLETAFKLGFRECRAVTINRELDAVRETKEYRRIMTTYCSERGN